jgi:hypothetical protein
LEDAPAWAEQYLRAVEFKLSPVMTREKQTIVSDLATLSALYSKELGALRASEDKPLLSVYSTLRRVPPTRWFLSRPWRYPRERLKQALAAELAGNSLPRARLVGSPEDYVRLWEQYA